MIVFEIDRLSSLTRFSTKHFIGLFGISKSSYHRWKGTKSSPITYERKDSRSLLDEEVLRILSYRKKHPEVGYKKLTYMLIDEGVAYVSESAVYRVLSQNKMLGKWHTVDKTSTSKEYKNKPKHVHHHWHTDLAYVKIGDISYYLIMMLDGYSRFVINWQLLTDMNSSSVSDFVQETKDMYPDATPLMIHDNGSQFVSRDFKQLVSRLGIRQVFTRRNHPQTNGKVERLIRTVRDEALRPSSPVTFKMALEALEEFVYTYNYQRLHTAIGFLRPADIFFGRDKQILQHRKYKQLKARKNRISKNKIRFNDPLLTNQKVLSN